jgi:hypothetical protein
LLVIRIITVCILLLGLPACLQNSILKYPSKSANAKEGVLTVLAEGPLVSVGTEFQRAIQVIDSYRVIDEVSFQVTPETWMKTFLNLLDPYRDFMLQKDIDVIMQAADNLYLKLLVGEPEALKSLYDVVNWRMAITVDQASHWLKNEPPMRPKVKYHKPQSWADNDKALRQRWRDKVFYFGLPYMVAGERWGSVAKRTLHAYQQQQTCLQEFDNGKLLEYAVAAYAQLVGVDAAYLPARKSIHLPTPHVGSVLQGPHECELPFISVGDKNRFFASQTFPILAGGVATSVSVLTLPNFDGEITRNKVLQEQIENRVKGFQKKDVSGLVVDLRGNAGESIGDAIFISKMLFGSGLLVQKKEFDGVLSVVEYVGDKRYRGAIVMLVDRSTSGAAEVLASAMQGRKQGIVIGERTGGVGKYKDATPLNNGVLEVVIGEYMTLAGHAIKDIGVSPDVEYLFMKSRVRHDAKSYVVALSKQTSFVRPSGQRQTALDAPLPYLRMKQKLRVDSSDSVPSYVLMKRQEDNYASRRKIMDIHSQKQVYRKLLSAQAKLAKTGVRDVELFQGLQITQDWIGVKNSGMRSW